MVKRPRNIPPNSLIDSFASSRRLIIRCAYEWRILPASVKVPDLLLRSNKVSPSSSSNRLIAMLNAGCVRNIFSAAREKLLSSAMHIKISSCARSISVTSDFHFSSCAVHRDMNDISAYKYCLLKRKYYKLCKRPGLGYDARTFGRKSILRDALLFSLNKILRTLLRKERCE